MSEPTVIESEYEVTEVNLFDRVANLEGLVRGLLESHKTILEHFQEMVMAVNEVASAAVTEEEVYETINLSLAPSEE